MMIGKNQYIERSTRVRHRQAWDVHISQNFEVEAPKSGLEMTVDPEWFRFSKSDSQEILQDQSNTLVITLPVAGIKVHRKLVDNGSLINILYSRTLR